MNCNIIIGGVHKAGTTSLYTYLAEHPDVSGSSIKETHFFSTKILKEYSAKFQKIYGKNVNIGRETNIECSGIFTDIGKGLRVGNNVGLGLNCFYGCAGGITIGDDTIIGNFVSMHSENHNCNNPDVPIRLQGVTCKGIVIGKNCWIGAKVTILIVAWLVMKTYLLKGIPFYYFSILFSSLIQLNFENWIFILYGKTAVMFWFLLLLAFRLHIFHNKILYFQKKML